MIITPADNVQQKIANATDSVAAFQGNFDFGTTALTLKGGRRYTFSNGAVLKWAASRDAGLIVPSDVELVGGAVNDFQIIGRGMRWANGNASRIKVADVSFRDMPGSSFLWDAADDITVFGCDFQRVYGYGVFDTFSGGNSGNRIVIEYNTYKDITHGGHLHGLAADCRINYNYIQRLTQMGFELQNQPGTSRGANNLQVIGNVIFDWTLKHWGNSCGISSMNQWSLNTRVENNYIRGNTTSDAKESGENHMSMGIEHAGDTGTCRGNMIGGPEGDQFVVGITVSLGGPNSGFGPALIDNNKFYGRFGPSGTSYVTPTPIAGWPTSHGGGYGRYTEQNSQTFPYSAMPAPVKPVRPNGPPQPPGPINMVSAPTNVAVKVTSATSADITWADNSTGKASFTIQRKTTRGNDAFVDVGTAPAGTTKFANTGLNTNWEYDWRVIARIGTDASTPSNVASAQITAPAPTPTPTPTPTPAPKPVLTGALSVDGYEPLTINLKPKQ